MRLPFSARLAFVLAVVAEIAMLVLAVRTLGGWATFWLMVATAFFGGWVVRKEGLRAWTNLNEALQAGRMPAPEGAPSQAALAGGFLLILPGFITDVIGVLLVIPGTRRWVQRPFRHVLPTPGERGKAAGHGGPIIQGDVIDGDIVDGEIVDGEVIDPPDDWDSDPRTR